MRLTFGRYIPTNSIIHKMDPRFKFVMIICLIVAVFMPIGYTGYLFLTATVVLLFAISKLSWRMMLKLFAPVTFIFIVILLINTFLMHPASDNLDLIAKNPQIWKDFSYNATTGVGFIGPNFKDMISADPNLEKAINSLIPLGHFWHWKFIWLSEKAVYSALLMGWRIYLMITLTTVLTGTTQPLELTLAIEDLLWPLKWIGVPVYVFSIIISIALRMIPTLIDEAGRIMKAQASRGIDFKNGKFRDKVKGLTSLIIPLLVSSFQKAEDLSYAMEARGYDPKAKRTRFIQFKFRWADIIIFSVGILLFVGAIVYANLAPTSGTFLHIPYIDQLITY
ncbi:energy-coupling factor transporter transmembrane component T family protein [Williamsoniiplasma lucivorax]|uniref:Cobalt ABC transporter permease n=1 Tax=Williamsoniiplasma lucivorax TaxID=209274 RepID=A0A2S5RFM9_9MOLU|nr:energy-coupling factor transporter transmembrane component T [Williamsoniiplasma lucivorax]PPE06113.1 cobalt ABC transporter permease [Williamsoniiplasma lucivorax]